jgi:hypothetical protein
MEEQEKTAITGESPANEPLEAPQAVPVQLSKKERRPPKSVFDKPENSVFSGNSPKLEIRYKLVIYRPNGTVKPEFNKALMAQVAAAWGDLMRCVPSNYWATMDEICQLVWNFEAKSYRKSFTRTRKQIEEGVAVLQECGMVHSKG